MNENVTVVFSDYKIYVVSEDVSDVESEYDDLEDLLAEQEEPDIYKDDHPWDTREYTGYRFRPDIAFYFLNSN